jgi:hypothetical protein
VSSKLRPTASNAKSRQLIKQSDGPGIFNQEAHKKTPGKVIQTKDLVSQLKMTSTRLTGHDKAREDENLNKYMDFPPKMDKSHIVAFFFVTDLVDPETAAYDKENALTSIFQATDTKTQSLIESPMTGDAYSQKERMGAHESIAL